jgi:hypothetical protein
MRYSLRSLLLGILVFALLGGWAADRWRATVTIEGLTRDMREIAGYQYLDKPQIREFAERQDLKFRPYYASIIDGTDRDIAVASNIDSLQHLSIVKGSISSEGWSHLAQMRSLERLSVSNIALEDAEMQAMGSLKLRELFIRSCTFDEWRLSRTLGLMGRLERLDISANSSFTGESYRDLQRLNRLERIDHAGTGFESQYLAYLSGFNDLHTLHLTACKQIGGGEAGRHLKALTSLKTLMLAGTAIDDNDIEGICELPVLWKLELGATRVTDAAVPNLGRLKSVRILVINGTAISPAGVARLRKLLPECDIHYGEY